MIGSDPKDPTPVDKFYRTHKIFRFSLAEDTYMENAKIVLALVSFFAFGHEYGYSQEISKHGDVAKTGDTRNVLVIDTEEGIIPKVGSSAYAFERIRREDTEKLITVAELEVRRVDEDRAWAEIVDRIEDSTLVGRSVSFSSVKPILRVVPNPGNAVIQIDTVEYQDRDSITVTLNSGTHRVQVSRWGYKPQTEELQLQSGDRKRLAVRLVPGPSLRPQEDGTFLLTHPSGANVDMVNIEGGRYQRGDWRGGGYSDQRPSRTILLSGFTISQKEITVRQFRAFVEETGHTTTAEEYGCWTTNSEGEREREAEATWRDPGFSQSGSHPVVCVSWRDAQAFAEWADARLPTEAEWEYAARGLGQKIAYPWGNTFEGNALNFADRRTPFSNASADDGHRWTAPVGSYASNRVGLYDMGGNVAEWCQDWYQPDYYAASSSQNPRGPSTGEKRVYRGGSWSDGATYAQTTLRRMAAPNVPADDIGFRIVWEGTSGP